MLLSLLLDSVYIQPAGGDLPFRLETLSDNSRFRADGYLIHQRNAAYFIKSQVSLPRIQWDEGNLILPSVELNELIGHYSRFQFYALQTIQHCIGVTGTNGKTTRVYYLEQMLQTHYSVATVGTLGVRFQCEEFPFPINKNTTLPLLDFLNIVKQLAQKGCQIVVMEVSSIGYCEGRVRNIPFNAL